MTINEMRDVLYDRALQAEKLMRGREREREDSRRVHQAWLRLAYALLELKNAQAAIRSRKGV